MDKPYDMAVIGGGMVGVSIAYQCARRGMRTILLERAHLASGGSGGNFGLVFWSGAQPDIQFTLNREHYGAARIAELADELDYDIEYRSAHGYCLICNDDELAIMAGHRDRFVAEGFSERLLTARELAAAEPNLCVGPEIIAALQTDEAVLNPLRLVHGYWRQAQRHGAVLATDSPAIGFKHQGNRVTHVLTPTGEVPAGQVVIAAGSWTRQVALTLGLSLPEYFIQAEAVVTEPLPRLLDGFVYWANLVRVPAEARIATGSMSLGWESRSQEYMFGVYDFGTVQTRRGNMLLGQMTHITPTMSSQATWQVMSDSAREALRLFPQLRKARVIRSWRSPAPFTPDHLPLLGWSGSYDNLLIASGFQSAITQCPWAGELIANLASGKPAPEAARLFDPTRFGACVAR